MATSTSEPRGIVLLSVGYLIVAILVVLSLSTTEILFLPVLYLIYEMLRRFNIFSYIPFFFQNNQEFSAQPELIYKSKLTGRKIRLLRLLPGSSSATLQCRLVEANLEDVPSYEAISYVWGPPQKRERIDCDGQVAYITISLAQALRRLRSRTTPITLWADGICINQYDVSEKGHQVERMGEIFKKASKVVIWLGPDEDGSVAKAMTVIRFVHSRIPNPGHGANAVQRPGDPTIENLEELLTNQKGVKKAWDMLGVLFNRQWWQRVWCVQEAILAKGTVVMCGAEQIEGRVIGMFTRWHHGQRWSGQSKPRGFNEDGIKSAYRRLNKWTWTGEFLDILDTFRGLQATDPRDKVYALLGLLQLNRKENIWKLNINVDYHKSVREVLFDAIMCSVRSEGNLHFLSYIDHRPDLEERGNYPSWMPRWDETREPWQDHLWCDSSNLSAGIRDRSIKFMWGYSEQLTLQGIDLDRISRITDVCWTTDGAIGDPLHEWIERQLWRIKDEANGDVEAYLVPIIRLATTLTGGFLKADGWVENRIYFERLAEDAGMQFMADFFAFISQHFPGFIMQKPPGVKAFKGQLYPYHQLVKTYCRGRRMFETVNGYIGLGPRSMREDDTLVVLDGGKVPYVLRPCGDRDFSFLGECFVYDIMEHQSLEFLKDYGFEEKDIVLR
ncbi:Nn.00g033450.m01.CDS01 [Neocucurbitaria sp. VM-36]